MYGNKTPHVLLFLATEVTEGRVSIPSYSRNKWPIFTNRNEKYRGKNVSLTSLMCTVLLILIVLYLMP